MERVARLAVRDRDLLGRVGVVGGGEDRCSDVDLEVEIHLEHVQVQLVEVRRVGPLDQLDRGCLAAGVGGDVPRGRPDLQLP